MELSRYIAGVDLGGTKIAAVLCDTNGKIINSIKVKTNAESGDDAVIRKITDIIRRLCRDAGVERPAAVGISSPGPLDVENGTILFAPKLNWRNVPLCSRISGEFDIPVYLENDANAAAYAEFCLGAGKGFKNIFYVTISTGIGCGIIINGNIYHGKHDSAGEFGHVCINPDGRKCSCGNNGCLEAYASGTAIAEIAKERKKVFEKYSGNIDCIAVEKAALEGNGIALEIWRDAGKYLGQGISILMQLFDPDAVILGGGVTKAWELFSKHMMDMIRRHTYRHICEDIIISRAGLGDECGAIGAAMVAVQKIGLNENN